MTTMGEAISKAATSELASNSRSYLERLFHIRGCAREICAQIPDHESIMRLRLKVLEAEIERTLTLLGVNDSPGSLPSEEGKPGTAALRSYLDAVGMYDRVFH